ncbi:Uncharacterized protein dnm_079900 [Desulfonema magnum]|uniref:Uncharacterized protein n=1 Tax=Desulfonema magnum TaxID=45655 RepID=A0A975GSH5_9BACT|nr:Uncharacterized protein dnm_079900 [Desulfonema magnum]
MNVKEILASQMFCQNVNSVLLSFVQLLLRPAKNLDKFPENQ